MVARFLDALARPGPAPSRTQLQLAVGVNYDILRRYVEFLERKGYATLGPNEPGKVETVRLTPAGLAVRTELAQWMARFLGEGGFAAPAPP